MNQLFPLAITVPLMVAAALLALRPFLKDKRNVRGLVAVAASVSVAAMLLVLTLRTGSGSAYWFAGFRPAGGVVIGIDFTADPLNAGLACLGAILPLRPLRRKPAGSALMPNGPLPRPGPKPPSEREELRTDLRARAEQPRRPGAARAPRSPGPARRSSEPL
jgi:hypothetical protein